MKSTYVGMAPQLTFTVDFHELLTGDLRPGQVLRLVYDPLRIAKMDEPVVHGDPAWPVTAQARFHIDGPITSVQLAARGMVETPIIDSTGNRGLMLFGNLPVPEDADLVSLWFTCSSKTGEQLIDDDGGLTYCFRFPSQDIEIRAATVTPDAGSDSARFAVELTSIEPVERVSIRYHVQNKPDAPTGDIELNRAGTDENERRMIWSGSVAVPVDSLIKFKVHYWLGGLRYKEDNGSAYFMAPQRSAFEALSMPDALVEAVRTWKW